MIKDTEYTNAVARVRCMENMMLSSSELESLILSKDVLESLKILKDKGYGALNSEYTENESITGMIRSMLREETAKLWSFVKDACPKPFELSFLLYENDFHNIKAQIKSTYDDEKLSDIFLPEGNVSIDLIKKAVTTADFSLLPKFLSSTSKEAYEALLKSNDGQLCGIIIDKGCLNAMMTAAKDSNNMFIMDLYDIIVSLMNIKIAVRGCRQKKPKSFFDIAIADCNSLDKSRLVETAAMKEENLLEYLSNTSFSKVVPLIKPSLFEFEKVADDMILDFVSRAKFKPMGPEPLIAYVFYKLREIKSARIILNLKNNLVNSESIRLRI